MMEELNLPSYPFKLKKENDRVFIFDQVRKKYLVLTPEEWVRQHFIMYLIQHLGYKLNLMAVEEGLSYFSKNNRSDILVYDTKGVKKLLVECKSTKVKITQKTFDQIGRYNKIVGAENLAITNGIKHYCCKWDTQMQQYVFFESIPRFSDL